jgi:hypothetical protein
MRGSREAAAFAEIRHFSRLNPNETLRGERSSHHIPKSNLALHESKIFVF